MTHQLDTMQIFYLFLLLNEDKFLESSEAHNSEVDALLGPASNKHGTIY